MNESMDRFLLIFPKRPSNSPHKLKKQKRKSFQKIHTKTLRATSLPYFEKYDNIKYNLAHI
ncbi:hypothetical protein LEP1GSC133_2544 [Leptospira borgpetersenii serovar Pomona str. 200901868]|uniref:Uncharacterized protein n=1 Tax=Leptospira borgpetersenii serovar Pomona str. 200901868 TaxID=1192866 RepID=M6W9Q5_LEPBO|nr:hypothetical protein LEP1GSC133_2544 [Leptospira borgpetersenii serovar Pomona str. 200901868]